MGETNFKEISKTAMFKQLSGGDLVPGERKYGTPFDFINHAKLLIGSNSIPASDDKSEGFGSRWIIIDFPNKFEVSRPVIDQIPEWEYENLCRKSIEKLRCLLERGAFCEEGDTSSRTKRYEEKSNPIQRFIDISCYKGEDMSVPLWKFVEAYDVYQEQHRLRKLTKKAINRWLLDRGYETAQDNITDEKGRHTWVIIYGLTLKVVCETCETCEVTPYTHEEKAVGNPHVSHVLHAETRGECTKPPSTDTINGLPPTNESTALSIDEKIWARITSHVKKYGRSDMATLRMIEGALRSEGYPADSVKHHINRYKDGHRAFTPPSQVIP
jgi:hypothetical protein